MSPRNPLASKRKLRDVSGREVDYDREDCYPVRPSTEVAAAASIAKPNPSLHWWSYSTVSSSSSKTPPTESPCYGDRNARGFGGGSWKGFGEYMSDKNEKLKRQLESRHLKPVLRLPLPSSSNSGSGANETEMCSSNIEATSNDREVSTIFKGCVILINGATNISDWDIRRRVLRHGGECEMYDRKRVTHIIGS
eukprot:GHVN01089777.1.p1 GENE.GHVN01089777.1~~GHVN01089777.1.p1  ORF type:complete len:194 (+),score=25.80 GHVN01089777.1:296-877(+)